MRRLRRRRSGGALAAAVSLIVVVGALAAPATRAVADTSPGPSITGLHCPSEEYPAAGTARGAASVPYEIPFSATLGQTTPQGTSEGGYLQVSNSLVTATLGGPLTPDPTTGTEYGKVTANACGLVQLPSETGGIAGNPYGQGSDPEYNNNFVFFQPGGISVTLQITGIPVLFISAYGAADGDLAASIEKTPAANGGLEVDFDGGAKSTSDFGPALATLIGDLLPGSSVTLPPALGSLLAGVTSSTGAACTLAIGNLVNEGVQGTDSGGNAVPLTPSNVEAVTGLTWQQATAPDVLTTGKSGLLTGQPVTGPVTGSDATLVDNDFVVGKISTSTIPAPGYPGTASCTSANANLLNNLLGLPSIPDPAANKYPNTFYAPGTFAVYTSS